MSAKIAPRLFQSIAFIFALAAALTFAQSCGTSSAPATTPATTPGAQSSATSAAPHSLPVGYTNYANPGGTGHLLYAKLTVTNPSATSAMRDFLGTVNNYFDAPPQLIAAVSNPTDQVVQVTLAGKLNGQQVAGVANVAISGNTAVAGLVYDAPASLRNSFKPLYQRLGQEMPQGGTGQPVSLTAPQSWTRQTGGDRSAAVNLPSGWKVDGITQGIVSVSGPHKEYVELGFTFFVSTMPGNRAGLSGPYLEPVPAFAFMVRSSGTVTDFNGNVVHQSIGRLINSQPVQAPMQGGKGANILQEMIVNNVPYKVFALVYTAPLQMTGWTLYTSYVAAPSDVFDAEFADMVRIWTSWKVDDAVYQRQMQQITQTMAETRAILSDTGPAQRAAQAADSMWAMTDNLINGGGGGEVTVNGQNVMTPLNGNSEDIVKQCAVTGQSCQVVPFNKLAGH